MDLQNLFTYCVMGFVLAFECQFQLFPKLSLFFTLPSQHPVVRNALFCLESAWKSTKEGSHGSHVYTKALLAYAFALAGNQEKKKEVLTSLESEAVKAGENILKIS